jgi:xanthine dehydrogenase YagS FAD-binding subunit
MTVATGLRLVRPESIEGIELAPGAVLLAGGTEVVPQLEDGLIEAGTLIDISGLLPREVSSTRIGAGATLAELEESSEIPEALRESCRLAASPQLRNMATVGGNLLQSTRCWYWRLQYPCRLHGGDRCHAREGEHREHAIFANDFCASAHPSDVAAALLALDATVRTNRRELPLAELYRLPEEGDTRLVTLEEGEVLLELELPPCDASVYLKAMDRKRFGFPLVGVAAVRRGTTTRIALAGVAPTPWLLDGPLDAATPLPGNAYKVEIARALVSRALGTIEAR